MTLTEFKKLISKYRNAVIDVEKHLNSNGKTSELHDLIELEMITHAALVKAFNDTNQKLEERSAALDKLNGWTS